MKRLYEINHNFYVACLALIGLAFSLLVNGIHVPKAVELDSIQYLLNFGTVWIGSLTMMYIAWFIFMAYIYDRYFGPSQLELFKDK